MTAIPFNRPYRSRQEALHLQEVLTSGCLAGAGVFTQRCHDWLRGRLGCAAAYLTPSCTDALEMAALLCDIGPGDEVILPSFTYVSTANAFALRGARLVFADISADTLTLDPACVTAAVTPRTRAIVAVHYGGAACDMDALRAIADRHGLWLIEDAAHAFLAHDDRGRHLGTIGDLGCFSFHETKNVNSGQGGALLVNDPRLLDAAALAWHKGTNRLAFRAGMSPDYRWMRLGSSYAPGELMAALLWAQLQEADMITVRRRHLRDRYLAGLLPLAAAGHFTLTEGVVRSDNAHLVYLLAASREQRDSCLSGLAAQGIQSVFHYVPLHLSPAGQEHGRGAGRLVVTEWAGETLLRLPLFHELSEADVDRVCAALAALCVAVA